MTFIKQSGLHSPKLRIHLQDDYCDPPWPLVNTSAARMIKVRALELVHNGNGCL